MHHRFTPALLIVSLAACGGTAASSGIDGGLAADAPLTADALAVPDAPVIGGSRPVPMNVPSSYVQGTPMPLVIMLHGYGFSGSIEEDYLGLTKYSDSMGFIYAYPEGTTDAAGNPFWNATDACCDLYHSGVDDSGYLSSVITQIEAAYTIDTKRVYIIGHSNGAFMAYRMACDHADQITAIVSLAGAMWSDVTKCQPSEPVATLEIHGTADATIAYAGAAIDGVSFPPVTTTVADWVAFDGCSSTPDTSSPPLDLDNGLPGNETMVTKYATDCMPGGHAELWTIAGGAHIPNLSPTFDPDVLGFMFAQVKP